MSLREPASIVVSFKLDWCATAVTTAAAASVRRIICRRTGAQFCKGRQTPSQNHQDSVIDSRVRVSVKDWVTRVRGAEIIESL